MAHRSDFYLILPSNASEPGNKTNNFRVRLPDSINLNGVWEVALVEIMYPHTWNNLTGLKILNPPRSEEDLTAMFQESEDDQNVIWCSYKPLKNLEQVIIPSGYYATPQDLIKAMNKGLRHHSRVMRERIKLLKELFPPIPGSEEDKIKPSKLPGLDKSVTFTYDEILKRIIIKLDQSAVDSIVLSKHLEYIMGFESKTDNNIALYSKRIIAEHPVDLRGGFYSLYVYCDLVENQVIGNIRAQLLQIVPIEGKNGDMITKTFYSPHYVPVLKKSFDSIEISIKDDTNKNVGFEYGKCVIKLHFRKKRAVSL